MSDNTADQQEDDHQTVIRFMEERVAPLLGEVFNGFVIAGIGVDGESRLMFFGRMSNGEVAPELNPVLRVAIEFVEAQQNSSQQPGGAN